MGYFLNPSSTKTLLASKGNFVFASALLKYADFRTFFNQNIKFEALCSSNKPGLVEHLALHLGKDLLMIKIELPFLVT